MESITGLWSNLFRAIEVAKTGGFSVQVYFTDDYGQGFEDYKAIKEFCKGWFDNFASDGDIKVEITKPYSYNMKNFETLGDISKRINKSLKYDKPKIELNSSSELLLKSAGEKLSLSLLQIERIKTVAYTIAQMDLSRIEAWHIAESIQYSYISSGSAKHINAESESIKFGNKIEIKLDHIDVEDIESAIKYLSKMLGR